MYKVVFALNSNVAAIDQVFDSEYDALMALGDLAQADADAYYDGDLSLALTYYAMVEV